MHNEAKATSADGTVAKVLLVDRHPAIREALTHRLSTETDLRICGECATIAEALELTESATPDLVVMEMSLADGNCSDFMKSAASRGRVVRVLVWSMFEPHLYAPRALRVGAWGFVSKECSTADVVVALRRLREGGRYFPENMPDGAATNGDGNGSSIQKLSDRELEVFRLLGDGQEMSAISQRLGVSVKTVETYRARIKQKLGIKGRLDLMRSAVEWAVEQRRMMPADPEKQPAIGENNS